mgnify:CR=1 FL=1
MKTFYIILGIIAVYGLFIAIKLYRKSNSGKHKPQVKLFSSEFTDFQTYSEYLRAECSTIKDLLNAKEADGHILHTLVFNLIEELNARKVDEKRVEKWVLEINKYLK